MVALCCLISRAQPFNLESGIDKIPVTLSYSSNTISTNGVDQITTNGAVLFTNTDWAAIPYFSYDLTTTKYGYGLVVLHSVTENFYAGLRYQYLNDVSTTASIQGQLQVSYDLGFVSVTPFVETSVGIGESALYGNAGSGLLTSFKSWNTHKSLLTIGLITDIEHYVDGNKVGNTVNIGLMVDLKW